MDVNEAKMREIQKNFDIMDDNKDGTVNKEEVRKLILTLGDGIKPGEVDKIIAQSDTNGDGEIDFEEFLAAATGMLGNNPKKKEAIEKKLRHEFECMCANKDADDHSHGDEDDVISAIPTVVESPTNNNTPFNKAPVARETPSTQMQPVRNSQPQWQ